MPFETDRYWTSGARLGTDTFFSADEFTDSKRLIFAIPHLQDIDFYQIPPLLPVDRWIIERTKETIKRSFELLYAYEIGSARHEISDHFEEWFKATEQDIMACSNAKTIRFI